MLPEKISISKADTQQQKIKRNMQLRHDQRDDKKYWDRMALTYSQPRKSGNSCFDFVIWYKLWVLIRPVPKVSLLL